MNVTIVLLIACVIGYFILSYLRKNPHVANQLQSHIDALRKQIVLAFSPPVTPAQNPSRPSRPFSPEPSAPIEPLAVQQHTVAEKSAQALVTLKEPSAVPLPAIPQSALPKGILLKLRRAQRSGVMGRVVFTLDARIEPSAEQLALIRKYGLGKTIVYDSEARQRHAAASATHIGAAADTASATPYTAGGAAISLASTLWRASKGAARAVAMALSLRCTIDSLIAGQHIECKNLDELLGAEHAIKDACETTRAFVDIALTFDGREEVLEF